MLLIFQSWRANHFLSHLELLLTLEICLLLISSADGSGKKWSFQTISEESAKNAEHLQIQLEQYKDFSLLIPLGKNSISQKSTKISPNIEFSVRPPSANHGIIAVIQTLDLRVDKNNERNCTDYLQLSNSRRSISRKTCGIVSRTDRTISPYSLIGQRAFYSNYNSTMNVQLVTKPTDPNSVEEAVNSVEIVFTAFTDCSSTSHDTRNKLGIQNCVNLLPVSTCIKENLICDKNLNCMVDVDFVGNDENICNKGGFWNWLVYN